MSLFSSNKKPLINDPNDMSPLESVTHLFAAIQIAGTASQSQIPFFVTACDYTLIGEEFFAASAYLSQTPELMGGLKGQDMMKAGVTAAILISLLMRILFDLGLIKWNIISILTVQ